MTFGWIFVFFCAVYHGAESEWVVGNGSGSWIGASSTCPGGRIAVPTLGSGGAVAMDSYVLEGDVISMYWVGIFRRRQYIKYIGCISTSDKGNNSNSFKLRDKSLTACIESCTNNSNTLVVGMMTTTCLCYTHDNFPHENLLSPDCFVNCTDKSRFKCGGGSSISMYKLENRIEDNPLWTAMTIGTNNTNGVALQTLEECGYVTKGANVLVLNFTNCDRNLSAVCEGKTAATTTKLPSTIRSSTKLTIQTAQVVSDIPQVLTDVSTATPQVSDENGSDTGTVLTDVSTDTPQVSDENGSDTGTTAATTTKLPSTIRNSTMLTTQTAQVVSDISQVSTDVSTATPQVSDENGSDTGTPAATTTELPSTIRSSTKLTTETAQVVADITQVSTDVSTDTQQVSDVNGSDTGTVSTDVSTATPQVSDENGSDTVLVVAVVTVFAVVILGVGAVVGVICYRKRRRHNVPCDDKKNDDQPARQPNDDISLELVGESSQDSQAQAQGAGAKGSATGSYVYAKIKNRLNAAGTVHADDGRIYSTANEPEHTYNRANFGTSDNDVYDHTDGVGVPKKGVTHVSENIYNKPMFSVDTENVYDHSIGHSHNGRKIPPGKLTENTYGVIRSKDDNVYDTTSTSTSTSAPSAKHGHVITENAYASTSTSAEAFSPTDTVN